MFVHALGYTKFRETELLKKGKAFLRLSSPVREKVSKERTFVRIELPPKALIERVCYGAATDARSSGGIVAQYAKMWFAEYRIAAVSIFAQGLVRMRRFRLRFYDMKLHGQSE